MINLYTQTLSHEAMGCIPCNYPVAVPFESDFREIACTVQSVIGEKTTTSFQLDFETHFPRSNSIQLCKSRKDGFKLNASEEANTHEADT